MKIQRLRNQKAGRRYPEQGWDGGSKGQLGFFSSDTVRIPLLAITPTDQDDE